MTAPDYEKAIVALICWKTMRGELYRGMVGLACMFRNRANAGWFEGSIYLNAVAFANESTVNWTEFPDAREPGFQNLLHAMDGLYNGNLADKTGGSLWVAHKSTADNIRGDRCEVGQYVFFKGE